MDYKALIETLEKHAKEMKRAYYAGTPGITYEDMAAAAKRVIEFKAYVEAATGRKVTHHATKAAIANYLRAL